MNHMVHSVAFVTVAHRADEERVLATVNGAVLLQHTVRGLLGTPDLDLVVVSAPERCAVTFSEALAFSADHSDTIPERCRIVAGASLRDVFPVIEPLLAPDAVVLVHDALRAFTPQRTVREVLDTVREGSPVVVPVLPMSDTVKTTDAAGSITATVDRDGLRTAQTPVGFSLAAFRAALSESTDPGFGPLAGATTVGGDADAMRVASAFELTLAEALVAGGDQEAPL